MAETGEGPGPVTPGVGRLIRFALHGHAFAFRRPSRADAAEAYARVAQRLQSVGSPDPGSLTNWLNFLDGYRLLWEARLEIGLRPMRTRTGQVVSLGETAPAHWLEEVRNERGELVECVISFKHVDPDEFDAVVEYLEEVLKKKDGSGTWKCIATAPDPTSG